MDVIVWKFASVKQILMKYKNPGLKYILLKAKPAQSEPIQNATRNGRQWNVIETCKCGDEDPIATPFPPLTPSIWNHSATVCLGI